MNRVLVIGSSCAGKTTFSRRLSQQSGLPHVELDALFWQPGWVEASRDEFRSKVGRALNDERWIVDGNYSGKVHDLVWEQADRIVWLDPSLLVILKRFFNRSIRRSLGQELLWEGCRETLRNSIFSSNSLLVWILKSHLKKRRDYSKLFDQDGGRRMRRLRTSDEVDRFLEESRSF